MLIFGMNKNNSMKIILTGLLIIYGLILLTRYLGPILLKYFLKRLSKKFSATQYAPNETSENPITSKKESKKSNSTVGEYIDFEEID